MQPPLDALRYVVDENLLRLGAAISKLRPDVACFGQHPLEDLLPSGIEDTVWIPIVGARGWIVVKNDRRIRTRPTEAALAIASHLKVIHLFNAGQLASWDQVVRLTSRWSAIERHVETSPDGPWWLSVRSQGVRAIAFQPGEPERS
jgi:hypothetical protein